MTRLCLLHALIAFFVVASSPPARAACTADFCWNVPTGSWFTGANWTPTGPPTSAGTVSISNGGTATIDATGAQSASAVIDTANSAVVVTAAGSWTVTGSLGFPGAITVGRSGTGGTLTIDNGGTVTTTGSVQGTVDIGQLSGSSGTITIGNGARGTALLTTSAPTSVANSFIVGDSGMGTLNVNAGGSATGFDGMTIGNNAGSSGSVTVNGGSVNALVNVAGGSGVLYVGGPGFLSGGGVGTLLLENGGTFITETAIIAATAGGNGSSATVTGSGSTLNLGNGGLQIGAHGNGSLTIASGGTVNVVASFGVGPQIVVAGDGGSGNGTLTVNGGTLSAFSGQIFVGANGSGSGTMIIENGGVVTTTSFAQIGPTGIFGDTSTGTVMVTGAGSSWNIGSGFLEVENLGTVTGLTVSAGASLISGETLIGTEESSAGNNAVVVTGQGTTWQSGVIILGNTRDAGPGAGTGTLSITSGAHVAASGNVDIGYSPDGGRVTDSIAVDGSGSRLTSAGNVRVGFFGTGSLIVSNGATISDVEGDIAYSSTNAAGSTNLFGTSHPTNSVGAATVTGAGSLWQSTTLVVGDNTNLAGFAGTGAGTATATLTISDGGEVASTNPIIVAANAGATGTINIGAAVGQAAAAPGTISAPAIVFGAGTGEIVFNHTGQNYVFGIPIEGPGAVDVESGTTVLTATSTYTGATTINGGTLDVTGSIAASSSVAVSSGATLTGAGTVATVTIRSGGTLAPGTAGIPGTSITIAGNLALQSSAIYMVQVNSASATFANVAGTASLAGDVVAAITSNGTLQHQYTILESTALNGTKFAALSLSGLPPGFTASLSYSTTDVFLDFNTTIAQQSGLNQNQQNVANALGNFFNSGGTVPANALGIFGLTGANLANALSQLSGEPATDAMKGNVLLMDNFLSLVTDPTGSHTDGSGPALPFAAERATAFPSDAALAYASLLKAPPVAAYTPHWSIWSAAFGGGSTTRGDPSGVGSHDVSVGAGAFATGVDYHVAADAIVGLALAGGGSSWGLSAGLGGGRSDALLAALYGSKQWGQAYVSGGHLLCVVLDVDQPHARSGRRGHAHGKLRRAEPGRPIGGRISGHVIGAGHGDPLCGRAGAELLVASL